MSETTDGGPAFPQTIYGVSTTTLGAPRASVDYVSGMSLRDWFAGQALAGMCSEPENMSIYDKLGTARTAYAIADAMLKARDVKP